MKKFKQLIRFNIILLLIGLFTTLSLLIGALFFNEKIRMHLRTLLISMFCNLGLLVIGVQVIEKGSYHDVESGQLIVSNHLSYLDILIIAAAIPSCFVTSVEIRDTPFLGMLARAGGCLFVERRSRSNLRNEINEISEALDAGLSVTVFPEATSTDGSSVLRFRRPLYRAAIDTESSILPLCLNYKALGEEPLTIKNRNNVFWYGDMPFFTHLWKLMSYGHIVVELDYLPIVETSTVNKEQSLAEQSHSQIANSYKPISV